MAPLTHSSKSPVQSVIIGTRSTLPPLALTSPGQRRRNCCEEYFSGCPPVSFEPCQVTQGRRRGEGLRWELAVPGPLWGTGGSAPPKGRRPKCGAGGGLLCQAVLYFRRKVFPRVSSPRRPPSHDGWTRIHVSTRACTRTQARIRTLTYAFTCTTLIRPEPAHRKATRTLTYRLHCCSPRCARCSG